MQMTETVQNKEKIHQTMMDKAYEMWTTSEENKNMSYEDFLEMVKEELGIDYLHAVITGNMNYQVENGGWYQWHDNNYSVTMEDLVEFFKQPEFKDSDEVIQLLRILDDLEEHLDWKERGDQEVQQVDYDFQDLFERALDDEFMDCIERLDSQYYQIREKIMDQLENYFFQKTTNCTKQ